MIITRSSQNRQGEDGMNYQIHPAAMLFPEMEGDQWSNFVADIRDNGQREPIIVHNGKVIDGRNRLKACVWLNIEPKVREYQGTEEDILSYVISLNLNRRHLSESQRAMVASRLATFGKGGDRKSEAKDQTANLRTDQAASMLNVSSRSVETARTIVRKGEPEVVAAVETGSMSLNEAAKVIQLRPDMQRAVANMPKAERKESLSAAEIKDMGLEKVATDHWSFQRSGLIMALEDLCGVKGTPEQLIAECPKYTAPDINKVFRRAFMKMQALNAAYQNWEFNNVEE